MTKIINIALGRDLDENLVIVAYHLSEKLKDYFRLREQIKIAKKSRSLRSQKSKCNQLLHGEENCFTANDICHDVIFADYISLCNHCKKIFLYTQYIKRCTAKANGIMRHLKLVLKNGIN